MEGSRQFSSDEVDMISLLRVVWEARYFVIVVTALAALFSVYLAMTATAKFSAHTVVMPATSSASNSGSTLASQFGSLAGIAGIDLNTTNNSDNLVVLKSRVLVESFITKFDLIELLKGERDSLTLWFAVREFQEEILSFLDNDETGSTTVTILWKDPETAARWANNFVALANETIRSRATAEAQNNVDYLNSQIGTTNIAEFKRVLYNLIEIETKTLMLANVRNEYAFSIVDRAVPAEIRSTPKRKLLVFTGTAIGVLLSLVLVFFFHLFKRVVVPKGQREEHAA